jgi:hypothetical protein
LGWEQGIATVEYDGKLYVGGYFFRAGDRNVEHIASWDGSSWSGLGTSTGGGIGGTVEAVAVYQGDVIAAGNFSVAGGVAVNNIARWNGTSWHALAEGLTGWEDTVRALYVYDGFLLAGGVFEYAGTIPSVGFARWDGSSWTSFGQVECGCVSAMTEYRGELVVAGSFCNIGGVGASRIARWDGLAWQPLGTGFGDCEVRALTVHGDSLIAGGCFTTANGGPGNRVACWDGTSWAPLGTGLSGDVYALADYQGSIVAGGYFDLGDGYVDLARWDGSAWTAFGGSFWGGVRALSVINGELYAGGGFGGIVWGPPASGIARYDGSNWNALGSGVGRSVLAMAQAEDPTGVHLYLGGDINWAGDGLLSAGVARWRLGDTNRPILRSITDIGNDQGRQVRLRWHAAEYDAPGQPVSVTGYAVFRQQDANQSRSAGNVAASAVQDIAIADSVSAQQVSLMAGWDYLFSVPAFGDTSYQCVAASRPS